MAKRKSDSKQNRPREANRRKQSPGDNARTAAQRLQALCLAGLVALIVATPLVPSESVAQGSGVVLAMLWTVLLVTWLLTKIALRSREIRIGWTGFAVLALISIHSISAIAVLAAGQGSGRPALNMLWQWVSYGICFLLIRELARTATHCRALCSTMIALAVSLSAVAYVQYFYEQPRVQAAYRDANEIEKLRMIRGAGITEAPPGSPLRRQFEDRLNSKEPLATFALTNSLAGFLAPWLVLALAVAISCSSDAVLRKRLLGVLAVFAILIAGCLFLTKSRSAWLATVGGIVLLAVYGRSRGWRPGWQVPLVVGAVGVLLGIGAVAVGGVDSLVVSEAGKSVQYRVEYWQATWGVIADHPWLGCGPGNFRDSYMAHKLPQASEDIADPHNFIFEVWATAGTLAAIALLAVLVCFALQVWRNVKRPAAEQDQSASRKTDASQQDRQVLLPMYAGAFVGTLLSFVAGTSFEMLRILMLVGLPVMAACLALLNPWVERGRLPVWAPVIALIALLMNLLAAGGIGFPGVGQSVWILMAVAINVAGIGATGRRLSKPWAAALPVLAVAVAGACYLSCYAPFVEAERMMKQGVSASERQRFHEAEQAFERAAQADPYAPEPWLHLSALHFMNWKYLASIEHADADAYYAMFDKAARNALARAPRSFSTHRHIGNMYLSAHEAARDDDPRYLQAAIAVYEKAVDNYPNGAPGHAQLAWLYHLAGDPAAAKRAANEALRLDGLNPHSEQKLANQYLFTGVDDPADNGPAPRNQNAEQLMQELRKTGDNAAP